MGARDSLPSRTDLLGDRADVIGLGRHLVDGVRVRAGPSRRREHVDVREAARGERADGRPAEPRRDRADASDLTTVA
ncbi:hypothetical protein OHA74_49295 [Streptomyces phaeochromogenes]|uniref:hypothetical protein n=1 Tax=Streptomyces phaeochromogenes TaxID=1923 RepID=UPI002DD99A49|nr:hypothetical protein [Streptomyces phaeochromogenes]WRZ34322.1 hypothetical protein OG931_44625 [Streptomyces phaeochromogenes]